MDTTPPIAVIATFTKGIPGCRQRVPLTRLPNLQTFIVENDLLDALDGLYEYRVQPMAKPDIARRLHVAYWRRLYRSPVTGELCLLPPLTWLLQRLPPSSGRQKSSQGSRHHQVAHGARLLARKLLKQPRPELADPEMWASLTDFIGYLEQSRADWVGDPWQRAEMLASALPWAA